MMTVPTKTMLHARVLAEMEGWEGVMSIIIIPSIMITMMIIVDNRVLAEMEGWEGIGQEELAALRHQVSRPIIHQN